MAEPLPLHDVHERLGARFGEWGGRLVPRHYGDPAGEYEAATTGAALVDRSERVLVRVHGREPVKMIQGLVTNDVAGVPEDRGVYALLLTPKGKIVADLRAFRRPGGEVLLDGEGFARDAVLGHLRKFVPPVFARFEDVSASLGVLGVFGPGARELLAGAAGVRVPADLPEDGVVPLDGGVPVDAAGRDGGDAGAEVDDGDPSSAAAFAARTLYAGVDGYDLVAPHPRLRGLWDALAGAGAVPAGHGTLEVLRIEAGRPRYGAELDETVIPLEAGLRERAISETKGCYTGQEVIVRILHRGHVNRHLRALRFGDTPAPASGAELFRAGDSKVVGRVTSACASPRFHQTIGLGYVRREIEPPATLRLGDPAGAEVEVLALE